MPENPSLFTQKIASAIRSRRTIKPSFYTGAPCPAQVRELIDTARYAPNHHRTEPARFYLLEASRIQKVGQLFGEVIRAEDMDDSLIIKAQKKSKEWGSASGLIVVTCHSDPSSLLAQKNPHLFQEDYATVSCICQNLLLLFESASICAKWSTGPVWKHREFPSTIGMQNPEIEKVVGLIFYGYSSHKAELRNLTALEKHLVDHTDVQK